MTRVDSHLHVWRAATGDTPGVNTIVSPQTDVPIEAAQRVLFEHAIDRAVLVQPVFRGEDNSYVAACAAAAPEKFAAVCVVDPRTAGAKQRLEHWAAQGCRGLRLRPRIAEEAGAFGDPATYPLWETAQRLGVVVSLLADVRHAATIAALAERFGNTSIVIDHLAHPDPAAGAHDAGFRQLLALARHPRVFIKLSGFYHFARQPFPFVDCWDLINAAYEHFGPQRLIWGSDFPHVQATCGYANALQLPDAALPDWKHDDRDAVMGASALELYWPR